MSSSLRTAVIGYGLAGRVFHCPFVSAVPGLELASIVVANPERAAAAHARYPNAAIVSSLDEVLSDPTISLIVVATPNGTHVEIATKALEAGKNVVVDKPLSATSEEALELIALARKQGKVLAPFHNRRYDGDFLTIKKLIEEDTLGRLVQVISHFDRYRPIQRPNSWKRAAGPAQGNLFDLGPHLIDQACALFGAPSHITASVRFERDQTNIDDAANVTLHYTVDTPNGPRPLSFLCAESMLAADPAPRFRVHGTLGSYTKYGVDPQEPTLVKELGFPPVIGSPEPWLPEPESDWGTLTLATKTSEPVAFEKKLCPTVIGDYRLFYANVCDAILGTAPLAITAVDGYRAIRLLELAVQSSTEQRTVPVVFEA